MTPSSRAGHLVTWFCGVLLMFSAVAVPAARDYQTVEAESLKITIDSDWVTRATPGYLPVRFDITNLGDARVIEIVGQGSRYFRPPPRVAGGTMVVRQQVRLAKGDRVRLTLPVPIFADNENIRFEVREANEVVYRFNYDGTQSRVPAHDASALIVMQPGSPLSAATARMSSTHPGRTVLLPGSSSSTTSAVDAMLEPERLPANWLGYTSVRAVIIGSTEWGLLNEGQKAALRTWTACGGSLIAVDMDPAALVPSARSEPQGDPERLVVRHFLGRIHALSSASYANAGLSSVLDAADRSRDVIWSLPANGAPDWGAIEGRGFRLRIPGIDGVPARAYLLIVVLFAFLIGPASYWFLWRRRRLVLLVLTAPVISVLFIVVLAGYAIAGAGFHVQGRAITFTLLDQARKQAATRATISLYAGGLTPSAGLRIARDTAVFPIGADGNGTRDHLDLDLTDAQVFAGGVLQARSPTNLEQITFRTARERLNFSREADGLSVTNALYASIALLLYKDGNTLYRLDGPLAQGAKHTLRRADPKEALPAGVALASKFLYLLQDQPPGSYLAVLDRSPFWEPGVSGLIERGSLHVVLGWPEGQP